MDQSLLNLAETAGDQFLLRNCDIKICIDDSRLHQAACNPGDALSLQAYLDALLYSEAE